MKVFVSSTCYDLTDARSVIREQLEAMGHIPIMSDAHDFGPDTASHRHQACVNSVCGCDFFIGLISGRYGASFVDNPNISITWAEHRAALENKTEMIVFVRDKIYNERESYKKNKDCQPPYKPAHCDNVKTFDFITELQSHAQGVWIEVFGNAIDIKTCLSKNRALLRVPQTRPSLKFAGHGKIDLRSLNTELQNYLQPFASGATLQFITQESINRAIQSIPAATGIIDSMPGSGLKSLHPGDYAFISGIDVVPGNHDVWRAVRGPTADGIRLRQELEDLSNQIDTNP